MAKRSRAREIALQLLFRTDRNPHTADDLDERFIRERLRGAELQQFAADLIAGVRTKREQLDRLVQEVAQNWSLSRMAPVDRSILRLAAYEILYRDDIPPKVAIDEAIELAKRFGTADSHRFVNGILDRILNQHPRDAQSRPDVAKADAEQPALVAP